MDGQPGATRQIHVGENRHRSSRRRQRPPLPAEGARGAAGGAGLRIGGSRPLGAEEKVAEVELAFGSAAEASRFYTAYEEIDLRPAAICRRYKDLAAQLELAQTTLNAVRGDKRDKIAEHTSNLVKAILDKKADQADLERYHDWVRQLQLAEYDATRRIDRLAADAGQLGYYLHTDPDTPDKGRLKGSLYIVHVRKAQWTNVVRVSRHWLLPWLWMTVNQPVETMVEVYQKVDPNKDLLAEKRKALYGDSSLPGQRLFVFEQTASGFVTSGGAMSLGELMRRCGEDEAFRRTCVVALPVYEESLTGERMLTKYSVFVRPLPGMVPAMPPRLSLVESLTYRLAWKEVQVGELASSINLAPGEERQITISKHFEQETTLTRTSSSIFDVSRAETSDLATEMENQTRQEQEHSSNLEMETKASGGWGPFSAEASAKAGTSTSLKSMSQALSKVAKKASQSVSQQNRQEISTSSSARTKITNVEETVAKIRNINQGRSLNLMFYRLYNKYEGGLFLEDLHFEIVPGVETIAGSGVHESRRYDLDDLAAVIDQLDAESSRVFAASASAANGSNGERILESISHLLDREYRRKIGSLGEVDLEDRPSTGSRLQGSGRLATPLGTSFLMGESAGVLDLPAWSPPVRSSPPVAEPSEPAAGGTPGVPARVALPVEPAKTLHDGIDALTDALKARTLHSDTPVDNAKQELLVLAPGLYLDAVVGSRPSTEPYSEEMRAAERDLRRAEVAVKESEGLYQRALASHLGHADGGNFIVGVLPDPKHNRLTLAVKSPLQPSDEWQLAVDGRVRQKLVVAADQSIVDLSWSELPAWMKSTEGLADRLHLVSKSGETIFSPAKVP